MTGMRRGELAGLRWSDWNHTGHRLSVARSRQSVAGRSVDVAVKTGTSRRCVDLDPTTEVVLAAWHAREEYDGHLGGLADAMFTNTAGQPVHAESISQLFDRHLALTGLPHPVPRPSPHPRQPARRCWHSDQGLQRTPRSRPPRLHDGHLSTPRPWHERRRRGSLRRSHRHRLTDGSPGRSSTGGTGAYALPTAHDESRAGRTTR